MVDPHRLFALAAAAFVMIVIPGPSVLFASAAE
jgi:threonine/homoserine/homoserine lactone efflux protein